MSDPLILSISPGIDLLGMAFEEEGFCIVRGPDLLWGGDIRRFHPPAGVFDGVVGGPPCQAFSSLRHLIRHNGHEPRFGNLIPEFERVCSETKPVWFLMENVPDAPIPSVPGYKTFWIWLTDVEVGGVQPRKRRFSFGTRDGRLLLIPRGVIRREGRSIVADSRQATTGSRVRGGGGKLPHGESRSILTSGTGAHGKGRREGFAGGRLPGSGVTPIGDACAAMGLPRDFTDWMPFTMTGKRSVIGNGVPLPMGRAVAKAVKRAMTTHQTREEGRSEPVSIHANRVIPNGDWCVPLCSRQRLL